MRTDHARGKRGQAAAAAAAAAWQAVRVQAVRAILRLCSLLVLPTLALASCVTPFPPGVVDPGRGAAPMPVGTTTVGASFGAGMSLLPPSVTNQSIPVIGGGSTVRVDTQVNDETAALGELLVVALPPQAAFSGDTVVGTSLKAGVQQRLWTDHLALRVLGGGGFGSRTPLSSPTGLPSAWWLHVEAETGLVASFSLLDDKLTPYAALSLAMTTPDVLGNVSYLQLFPGAAIGAACDVADGVAVSLAVAGHAVAGGLAAEAYAAHAHLGVRLAL